MPVWGWALIAVGGILLLPIFLGLWVGNLATYKLTSITALNEQQRKRLRRVMEFDGWASANGFALLGWYRLASVNAMIAIWEDAADQRYLMVMHRMDQRITHELTTVLSERVELTTSSNLDSCGVPLPPGKYAQAFPGKRLHDIWLLHLVAERVLFEQGRVMRQRVEGSFDERFVASIRKDLAYLRRLPFWQYRLWYWVLVRKRRYAHVSIRDQLDRDWIRLPWELRLDQA